MANVIPHERKKNLGKALHARFISMGSIIFLIGACIASASLLPAIISVRLARASLPQDNLTQVDRDDQAKYARALALVHALGPLASATSSPSEVVQRAVGLKPAGISITSVTYRKGQIVLSGISSNRLAVNAFREALEKEERFSTVSVPVAALVGTREGRFTVTLSGAF